MSSGAGFWRSCPPKRSQEITGIISANCQPILKCVQTYLQEMKVFIKTTCLLEKSRSTTGCFADERAKGLVTQLNKYRLRHDCGLGTVFDTML